MIEIKNVEKNNFRTFGWVQDPSNFDSLYDVVCIFNENSLKHKELVNETINSLVEERDGKTRLIEALNRRPLKITYSNLVGSSFTPRSSARCNGIVQATVKGQRRPYIGDWPADNFVRWAQCLGFIKYNYYDDTFEITNLGLDFSNANNEEERNEILENALLGYPPAVRILSLLEDGTVKTKFELGRDLGFVGEDGFTSLPQDILIMTLATEDNPREKNKLKTDTEGSADKYARMIAKWLTKLGLLAQVEKTVESVVGGKRYSEKIGQSFVITSKGLKALNKARGKSRFKRISKIVSWEMLCTNGKDRDYIRTRRAYILKILNETSKAVTAYDIRDKLKEYNIFESANVVEDDIIGLIKIGLNIKGQINYMLEDDICDFIIPRINNSKEEKTELTRKKDLLREKLDYLSHEYLSLIDLSFDSKQNRLFEMKVIELLINECKYLGMHLGGSRKPDGIVYTKGLESDYGIIIDTKAYSNGYDLPISQVDEMIRYIIENNIRDKNRNANEWWNNFDSRINEYYYSFVSGRFKGNINEKLERIFISTNIRGAAISIFSLLKIANEIKAKRMTQNDIKGLFVNNIY